MVEICDYCIDIFYNEFKNRSKDLLWNTFYRQIIKNLDKGVITVPMRDEGGTFYLDNYYSLYQVTDGGVTDFNI